MNCVIIGTGWLGFPLANALAKNGHQVWGSSRSGNIPAACHFTPFIFPGDSAPLKQAEVVVIAFPPNRSTADAYTNDCLQVVGQCADSCRIILISSTGAYTQTGICDENDVIHDPDSTNTLVRAESQLRAAVRDRLTVVRLAGLIGPDRYPVRAMLKSGKTYAGNDPVNVIHLHDAVGLIVYLIERKTVAATVNGCAPEHPLRKDFYRWMAAQLGTTPPPFADESSDAKIINPELSVQLGYTYLYSDPFTFPL